MALSEDEVPSVLSKCMTFAGSKSVKEDQTYIRAYLYQGVGDIGCTLLYLQQGTTLSHEASTVSTRREQGGRYYSKTLTPHSEKHNT